MTTIEALRALIVAVDDTVDEPTMDPALHDALEQARAFVPEGAETEGCMTVRTHQMAYIGQGVWRCSSCGYEPDEPDPAVTHPDHSTDPDG